MSVPASEFTPQEIECYRVVRAQIEFEDGLTTQRLSWFVAAQAFLFSAYAITLNAPTVPASTAFAGQSLLVYRLIPVVAMAACFLIYLAIVAGVLAQYRLRRFLGRSISCEKLAHFPMVQGHRDTRLLGLAAPLGLPIVFIAVWITLFARGLA